MKGIIYVAFGKWYVEQFLESHASLRQSGNHEPVIIIGADIPPSKDYTIIEKPVVNGEFDTSRFWKTQVGLITPWSQCLFLDCDTRVVKPLSVWNVDCEIAMRLDIFKTLRNRCQHKDNKEKPEDVYIAKNFDLDVPYYNSGVIVWKNNPKNQKLFKTWHQEWLRYRQTDQPALSRALQLCNVTVTTFDEKYNQIPVAKGDFKKKVVHGVKRTSKKKDALVLDPEIVHYHGRFQKMLH